ncbi:putative Thioesterase-like superfamily-domain-containing protein [Seiridium cardinale]|uniref:Thioesterase-like superfamily-domain-containing protein n=1 Tax=Seiridium cardinale TaxID=138064 RepID=A0ABR2XP15_9PEZI
MLSRTSSNASMRSFKGVGKAKLLPYTCKHDSINSRLNTVMAGLPIDVKTRKCPDCQLVTPNGALLLLDAIQKSEALRKMDDDSMKRNLAESLFERLALGRRSALKDDWDAISLSWATSCYLVVPIPELEKACHTLKTKYGVGMDKQVLQLLGRAACIEENVWEIFEPRDAPKFATINYVITDLRRRHKLIERFSHVKDIFFAAAELHKLCDTTVLVYGVVSQRLDRWDGAHQLGLDEVSPGEFVSKVLPGRMGNLLPIAYGGCTLGLATHAACKTVPSEYSLYSLTGQFLGPASTKEKLSCTVHTTRNTRTFATRRVQVSQIQPDGSKRICLELLADFHVLEPALLTYSAHPTRTYSGPEQSKSIGELAAAAVAKGEMNQDTADAFLAAWKLSENFFDTRFCPEGVSGQNLIGALKHAQTTQDHLPVPEKTTGDWIRTRVPLETPCERTASVSFLLDVGLSFIPLTHSHLWFEDSRAFSTLDFALRLFVPDVDLDSWHLRERKTLAAGFGRTFTEARLWNEKGTLVATMTQQCIMRPISDGKEKQKL